MQDAEPGVEPDRESRNTRFGFEDRIEVVEQRIRGVRRATRLTRDGRMAPPEGLPMRRDARPVPSRKRHADRLPSVPVG